MTIAHLAADKKYSHFDLASTNGQGKWEIDFINVTAFLVERGYFIYRTSVERWIIIRIVDNIVKQVGKKDLKDELLNYICKIDIGARFMHQFFLKNIGKAVSDEFIETLPEKNVEFRKDRPDAIQVYYQNCIVKIQKEKITTHSYSSLNGYIWESQILDRDYIEDEILPNSDFCRFIFHLANKEHERANSICSAFGFYLHNHKFPGFCPAVILNDEVISDHPEGGTGKGLFFKAVSKFVKMLKIDGKTFNFDKNFVYARVTKDTRLVFFDDVKKNFDFERLFSVITEGMVTEKKGKDEEYLDYHDSPKIGISTNYAIRGSGNSHDRRRFEIEISQHYNKNNNPRKEFGRMMFDEWPRSEWIQFDNYMIQCCQLYLKNSLIGQKLINLEKKRLTAETNQDFLEFIKEKDLIKIGLIGKKTLIDEFLADAEDMATQKYFTKQLFTKWLNAYCKFNQITLIDCRDTTGSFRCYQFVSDKVKGNSDKI